MGTALEKEWKYLLAKEEKMLSAGEHKKETKLDGKIKGFTGKIEHNSRIETFRCKSLSIHRTKPGVIHFDGAPVDTTADVEVAVRLGRETRHDLAAGLAVGNVLFNPLAEKMTGSV